MQLSDKKFSDFAKLNKIQNYYSLKNVAILQIYLSIPPFTTMAEYFQKSICCPINVWVILISYKWIQNERCIIEINLCY